MPQIVLYVLLIAAIIAAIAGLTISGRRVYKKLKAGKVAKKEESQYIFLQDDDEKKRVYEILRRAFDGEKTIIPDVEISELMATVNENLGNQTVDFVVYAIGKKPIMLIESESEAGDESDGKVVGIAKLIGCGYMKILYGDSEESILEKLGKFSQ